MKHFIFSITLLSFLSCAFPAISMADDNRSRSVRDDLAESRKRINCDYGYTCDQKKDDPYKNIEPSASNSMENSFQKGGAPKGSIGRDILRGFERR